MLPRQTAYNWAHVEDIVQGHILAMKKGRVGESYIICGEKYELYEAFKLAAQTAGVRAPLAAAPAMMKAMSVLVKPVDAFMPESYTSEGLRIISGVTYIGDNSKAKQELGYSPRPMSDGWVETVRHEMKLLGR